MPTIDASAKKMENVKQLAKFLGGRPVVGSPKSDFEFIKIIRDGLPSTVIESMVDSSAISAEVLFDSLRIARRTAARRKAGNERLRPSESELVFRFAKVWVAAVETLGNEDKARQWLLNSNQALHGERPIDLLDTGIGFQDVLDVLNRIEFGVYS